MTKFAYLSAGWNCMNLWVRRTFSLVCASHNLILHLDVHACVRVCAYVPQQVCLYRHSGMPTHEYAPGMYARVNYALALIPAATYSLTLSVLAMASMTQT